MDSRDFLNDIGDWINESLTKLWEWLKKGK